MRSGGQGALITRNPQTAAPGVETRPSVLAQLTVASGGHESVAYQYGYGDAHLHTLGHYLLGYGQVIRSSPRSRTSVSRTSRSMVTR